VCGLNENTNQYSNPEIADERQTILKKTSNPTWDYYKLILFVLFLAELVLVSIAILFGRIFGYDWTFKACFWLGVILAGCFMMVVVFNLLFIFGSRIFQMIVKK